MKIETIDAEDLLDNIGELSLSIHFKISQKKNTAINIKSLLGNTALILGRYTPFTDKLSTSLYDFSDNIVDNKYVDKDTFLYIWDCVEHDLINFIEYSRTLGLAASTQLYIETYKNVEQLIMLIKPSDYEETDIFFI